VDEDDPTRAEYPPGKYTVRAGLRSVVPWINELAVPAAERYAYVGMVGDDVVPHTRGWDVRIIDALQKTPFVFANDLYPRDPWVTATHIFCRSEVIRALGYLGMPTLKHFFVDNAWMTWGKACGITYLQDVIIEHMHFTTGKAAYDDTYKASVVHWDSDEAAWKSYQSDKLAEDIAKIKEACGV